MRHSAVCRLYCINLISLMYLEKETVHGEDKGGELRFQGVELKVNATLYRYTSYSSSPALFSTQCTQFFEKRARS